MSFRRLEMSEVISRFRQAHGEKYDYSQVNYVNQESEVCILCPEHGEFFETPRRHSSGAKCPSCISKWWIRRLREWHGEEYDYTRLIFPSGTENSEILDCPKHGDYYVQGSERVSSICPACSNLELRRLMESNRFSISSGRGGRWWIKMDKKGWWESTRFLKWYYRSGEYFGRYDWRYGREWKYGMLTDSERMVISEILDEIRKYVHSHGYWPDWSGYRALEGKRYVTGIHALDPRCSSSKMGTLSIKYKIGETKGQLELNLLISAAICSCWRRSWIE